MSKRAFKTEPAPCRKPPQGGLTQAQKKKEREKKKEKRKKNNRNKKDFTNKKTVSLVAKWDIFAGNVLLNRDKKLRQLTPGLSSSSSSSGLDLSSAMATILTPDVPVAQIPTGVACPLPEDIVRLVLGRSLLSLKKILVVPGVVDSDYTVKIKVLISPPAKPVQINKGQKIAQLLLLPYYQTEKP